MQKICSECKYPNLPDSIICHQCGADISEIEPTISGPSSTERILKNSDESEKCIQKRICFACNHSNAANQLICNICGADISAVEPAVPPDVLSDNPCSLDSEIPRIPNLETVCQVCDYKNPPGEVRCARCGAMIESCEPVSNPNLEIISAVPQAQTQADFVESPRDAYKTGVSNNQSLIIANKYGETIRFHSNDILGRNTVSTHNHNGHVSELHAVVIFRNNTWFIRDTCSLNGTFINGVKVEPGKDYPIQTGDLIALSRFVTICVR